MNRHIEDPTPFFRLGLPDAPAQTFNLSTEEETVSIRPIEPGITIEEAIRRTQSEDTVIEIDENGRAHCGRPEEAAVKGGWVGIETLGTALSWFRDRTLETWKPVWLFLTKPKPDRLIGVGWRGVLVIWRNP